MNTLTDKMETISKKSIERNLDFLNDKINKKDMGRDRHGRYASFDYCFNYFQSFKRKKDLAASNNMQNSCLHLGFYLASWGMYRGSSFILQKSMKIFEPLIKEYLVSNKCDVWDIDVDKYDQENSIEKLIECYNEIKRILLRNENKEHKMTTLVTKIMLGVFGNVPAFDTYFVIGSGLTSFSKDSLKKLQYFYEKHKDLIFKKSEQTKTFDFDSDRDFTTKHYTKAKIIDMIFFTEGYRRSENISL